MTAPRSFRVLDAGVPEERDAWERHWGAWPDREVFAHPDYVSLFCGPGERPLCLAQEGNASGVLLPVIQRRLGIQPWCNGDSHLTDLVSPYGYGGAYFWGDVDAAEFWRAVQDWAHRECVVSCFLRLPVLEGQVLDSPWKVECRSSNVVRDLDLDAEALWTDFDHKVRKNVKRARRAGLEIQEDPGGECLPSFTRIYRATMDRRAASAGYYFSDSFFSQLVERLRGQYCFFHCRRGDDVISTELVLVSTRTIYSFLGGTEEDAFPDRPNDLLKHHVILWGKSHGKSRFVLGGGYEEDDGIFRYKRSFAPQGVVPFRVGTGILDESAYVSLCQARAAWERHERGVEWKPSRAHFPAYRG